MIFKIKTSGSFYDNEENRKKLETLGFTFRLSETVKRWMIEGEGRKEINTIEELIEFEKEWGTIIFSDGLIELYDDWRE